MNNHFHLSSDYGHIDIGPIYIGWMNNLEPSKRDNDYGDEAFGFSLFNFYIGCYSDGKWCAGFLDKYGCLSD